MNKLLSKIHKSQRINPIFLFTTGGFILVSLILFPRDFELIRAFRTNVCNVTIAKITQQEHKNVAVPCAQKLVTAYRDSMISIAITYGLSDSDRLHHLERLALNEDNNFAIQIRLGELLWKRERREEAIEVWQKVDGADVYFALQSVARSKAAQLPEAHELAQISYQIDPMVKLDKLEMYSNLCDSFRNVRQPEVALLWCKLSDQVQKNGWRQVALANVKYDLGDYQGALETLQQSLQIQAVNLPQGLIYHKLGQAYFMLGNLDESARSYRLAIEHEFTTEMVYRGLIKTLLRIGEVDEACETFSDAQKRGHIQDLELDEEITEACK